MPKIKTKKAAAKRFKKTGSGKVKHFHAFHSHLLGHKTSKRKRRLRKSAIVSKGDMKIIKKILPY
ncbi:50S ribosomal protein L35 [Carboxydothermus hydrogenoformans]|uniref:Large ribosomal subunit protein bL35 n=1 Tax=Carboxydothermus hydrogenoformans (strain ATCC BAA-161 / DSM 6008 / Z-2901) TaxID=246194 RepID=RL35_CARHZ|nr:50S ribosomal protein L35 [Carboxydothermus hydrogenoformans]Q3ABS8.1 RecName: Full=Large ribosomal subunit protein bL35; AltName: Full=50S ribosomal protein L35 [Carboxydothermus hydrogenoformans Z-2901]ABB15374.1 ribosomal protein L35 [Carboxydothermus hydrogenoformans Z-2901]